MHQFMTKFISHTDIKSKNNQMSDFQIGYNTTHPKQHNNAYLLQVCVCCC